MTTDGIYALSGVIIILIYILYLLIKSRTEYGKIKSLGKTINEYASGEYGNKLSISREMIDDFSRTAINYYMLSRLLLFIGIMLALLNNAMYKLPLDGGIIYSIIYILLGVFLSSIYHREFGFLDIYYRDIIFPNIKEQLVYNKTSIREVWQEIEIAKLFGIFALVPIIVLLLQYIN